MSAPHARSLPVLTRAPARGRQLLVWAAAALSLWLVPNARAASTTTVATRQAEMRVTPAQGARGARISLTGSHLPARHRASLLLGRRRLTLLRTDRHGDWSARARIPRSSTVGDLRLRVLVGRRQVIRARFVVSARSVPGSSATTLAVLASGEQVALSPTRSRAGTRVKLAGVGFRRRALVAWSLGRTHLETVRASATGSLVAAVRIPIATRPRRYVTAIRAGRHELSLRLAVTRPTVARAKPPPPVTVPPPLPAPGPGPAPTPTPVPTPGPDPVVDAAGDLACSPQDPNFDSGIGDPSARYPADSCVQRSVSNLVAGHLPSAFLTMGDNQYGTAANGCNEGTLADYSQVFGPTFGRADAVVYPEVGDGDFGDTDARGNPCPQDDSGFMQYFTDTGVFTRIASDGGNNANLTSNVYYSFNIGRWHIIALNSQCADLPATPSGAGGCGVGSAEEKWLKADLVAHPNMCTLAYWHVPRWNSGGLGNRTDSAAFWTDLYNAHADVVLNAHGNNHYERFLPQNPSGQPDPAGIREFIVSNGGYSHGSPPATPGDPSTSVVADYTSFGILQLTLHPTGYSWQFMPAAPGSFTDSGSASCHSAVG